MKGLEQVSTLGMSREEWLERRRHSIGGSDAAAIVGLTKWASPYTVWADKTGRLPEKEETEAMRLGRDLEQYVATRWSEATGKKVRRVNAMLYNSLYPFAHADVDRWVIGENAGLECKTTSTLDVKQFHGVEFPEQYYAQCVHYMAVTGADRWYLGVLVFGRGFFEFCLERDQAEIDALMGAEERFWPCVVNDVPPAPDGTEATTEAIGTIYRESAGGEVDLFGRERLIAEYFRLKASTKELEGRTREIENILKTDMGDAEKASCGAYRASWASQERRTFDTKAFQAANPGVDLAPYYKTTTVRPFRLTETK